MASQPSLKRAFTTVTKTPSLIAMAIVVDVFFIIAFGGVYTYLFSDVATQLDQLNGIIAQQTAAVTTTGPSSLQWPAEASALYNKVLMGIATLIGTFWLLWSVTQGINWWLAHEEGGMESSALRTLGRMLLLNIVWIALALLIVLGIAWLGASLQRGPVPLIGPGAQQAVAVVLLCILGYGAIASYALVTHPARTMVVAFKRWRTLVPRFALFGGVLIALGIVTALAGKASSWLGLLCLVVFLGWLALCRLWFVSLAHDIARLRR